MDHSNLQSELAGSRTDVGRVIGRYSLLVYAAHISFCTESFCHRRVNITCVAFKIMFSEVNPQQTLPTISACNPYTSKVGLIECANDDH